MAGLVADYGSSSESEHEENHSVENEILPAAPLIEAALPEKKVKKKKEKLANPLRNKRSKALVSETASVFYNPFHKAQEAKQSVLEKHVKMTVNPKDVIEINGKKICWNYRKGRCKFGHNCKYAHDSDLIGDSKASNESSQVPDPKTSGHSAYSNLSQADVENDTEEQKKRKIRAGLSDGLHPNKKSRKLHKHLQQKERPWIQNR